MSNIGISSKTFSWAFFFLISNSIMIWFQVFWLLLINMYSKSTEIKKKAVKSVCVCGGGGSTNIFYWCYHSQMNFFWEINFVRVVEKERKLLPVKFWNSVTYTNKSPQNLVEKLIAIFFVGNIWKTLMKDLIKKAEHTSYSKCTQRLMHF